MDSPQEGVHDEVRITAQDMGQGFSVFAFETPPPQTDHRLKILLHAFHSWTTSNPNRRIDDLQIARDPSGIVHAINVFWTEEAASDRAPEYFFVALPSARNVQSEEHISALIRSVTQYVVSTEFSNPVNLLATGDGIAVVIYPQRHRGFILSFEELVDSLDEETRDAVNAAYAEWMDNPADIFFQHPLPDDHWIEITDEEG